MQVNGETVTELGTRVQPGDVVWFDGGPVEPEPFEYHLLNKPGGVISAVSDSRGQRTVTELVPSRVRLFPVGRLDRDTTGLIVLTNDGALANRLMHPRFEVDKVYRAEVDGQLTEADLKRLREGIRLEEGMTAPAQVELVAEAGKGGKAKAGPKKGAARGGAVLELTIHEGRKRQVRRMLEAVGHPVRRLHRKKYAMLTDDGLESGDSRLLTDEEITALRKLAGP